VSTRRLSRQQDDALADLAVTGPGGCGSGLALRRDRRHARLHDLHLAAVDETVGRSARRLQQLAPAPWVHPPRRLGWADRGSVGTSGEQLTNGRLERAVEPLNGPLRAACTMPSSLVASAVTTRTPAVP
jgi:hypothetical protein